MDSGQYRDDMKKLHQMKKTLIRIFNSDQPDGGNVGIISMIGKVELEIKRLRFKRISSLPLLSNRENFYPPNIGKRAYDYYIDYGHGIMSAPMNYDEFIERMRKKDNSKRSPLEKYLGEPNGE